MKPDCVIIIIASDANQRIFFTLFFVIVNPLILLVGVVVERHYQSLPIKLVLARNCRATIAMGGGGDVITSYNTISDPLVSDRPAVNLYLGLTAIDPRCG